MYRMEENQSVQLLFISIQFYLYSTESQNSRLKVLYIV